MPNDLAPYPDSEDVLRRLFIRDFDELADLNVGNLIVDDIAARLPYVRVERFSGPSTRLNDYPVMDVEAFASTNADAKALCRRLTDYLLDTPRSIVVAGKRTVVDEAECNLALERRPWEDKAIARFGSILRLTVRR